MKRYLAVSILGASVAAVLAAPCSGCCGARIAWGAWSSAVPAHALGALAASWFFERLSGFVSS